MGFFRTGKNGGNPDRVVQIIVSTLGTRKCWFQINTFFSHLNRETVDEATVYVSEMMYTVVM